MPDDDTLFLDGGVRLAAGTPFLAMEFIEGSTLHRKRTETGPLALEEVLDLAHQIAEALAEAHTHGIVHRDLKPGNVMVTGAGRVKILDFGLAKMLGPAVGGDGGQDPGDSATTSTQAGVLAGTPAYMSPEQVRGQAVDARSDVFSFGTMLYALLADRHPFPGESLPLVLAQVLEGQPDPLSRIRSDVPPELERIVRRCLEKRPERRYNDTRDLLNSVRDLRTGFWGSAGRSVTSRGAAGGGPTSLAFARWRARRTLPGLRPESLSEIIEYVLGQQEETGNWPGQGDHWSDVKTACVLKALARLGFDGEDRWGVGEGSTASEGSVGRALDFLSRRLSRLSLAGGPAPSSRPTRMTPASTAGTPPSCFAPCRPGHAAKPA